MFSVIVRVMTVAMSFVSTVVVARLLGVEDFGVYSYALAVAAMLARFANFGAPELIVRIVSTTKNDTQKGLICGIVICGCVVAVLLSIISAMGYFAFWKLGNGSKAFPLPLLWALLGILPLGAICSNFSAVLNGLGKIKETIAFGDALRLFMFLLAVLICMREIGLVPSPLLAVKLGAASYLLLSVFIMTRVVIAFRGAPGKFKVLFFPREWARAAFGIGIFGVVTGVYQQIDIIMLESLSSAREVGLYQVANRSANLLTFVLAGASVTLSPLIAQLYSERNRREIEKLCNVTVRYMLLSCIPIVLFFMTFGGRYLDLVFGVQYHDGYAPLVILSTGYLFKVAMEINQVVFFMSGVIWPIVIVNFVGLIISAGLCQALIPSFGAIGSALASASSLLAVGLLQGVLARRLLGVSVSFLGSFR